jgi:proteasome lid subunit RPN8/RPN11
LSELKLPKTIYDQMVEDCLGGAPNEACGFLAGKYMVAVRIFPLENSAASPVFYKPDGKQMIAALTEIDDQELDLLAIYHSHVASAPYPSATDIREAHYPDCVYVIVSLADDDAPRTKGFFIRKNDWRDPDGEVEEVELVIS